MIQDFERSPDFGHEADTEEQKVDNVGLTNELILREPIAREPQSLYLSRGPEYQLKTTSPLLKLQDAGLAFSYDFQNSGRKPNEQSNMLRNNPLVEAPNPYCQVAFSSFKGSSVLQNRAEDGA